MSRESRLYYTPPPDEQFEELRSSAISLWKELNDNKFGYVTKKVNSIKDIGNIEDNFMYIIAMFDHFNQIELASRLSEETKISVRNRMIDGGTKLEYIYF